LTRCECVFQTGSVIWYNMSDKSANCPVISLYASLKPPAQDKWQAWVALYVVFGNTIDLAGAGANETDKTYSKHIHHHMSYSYTHTHAHTKGYDGCAPHRYVKQTNKQTNTRKTSTTLPLIQAPTVFTSVRSPSSLC
jgi:hypothetical protein